MSKKYGPGDEFKIKSRKEILDTIPMKEVEEKISQLRKSMEES